MHEALIVFIILLHHRSIYTKASFSILEININTFRIFSRLVKAQTLTWLTRIESIFQHFENVPHLQVSILSSLHLKAVKFIL